MSGLEAGEARVGCPVLPTATPPRKLRRFTVACLAGLGFAFIIYPEVVSAWGDLNCLLDRLKGRLVLLHPVPRPLFCFAFQMEMVVVLCFY